VVVGICYENISALGYQAMFSMDHEQQSAFIISQKMCDHCSQKASFKVVAADLCPFQAR
jgi:hypothetical protein